MDKKKHKRRRGSVPVLASVLVPMLVMALINMALTLLVMNWGGVFDTLNDNAVSLLEEHTQNVQLPLQQQMLTHEKTVDSFASSIAYIIEQELAAEGKAAEDIAADAALNARLAERVAPELIMCMRAVSATGSFLILDGAGVSGQPDTYAGVYFRDTDPATVTSDNSDVLLERGLPPLARSLGLSLDSFWNAAYTFDGQAGSEYFFRPLEAVKAVQGKLGKLSAYGCWTGPMHMAENDSIAVIHYSMPLVTSGGRVLGVIGTELTLDSISSALGVGEYERSQTGSFLLARADDQGNYACITATGSAFLQHFGAARDAVLKRYEQVDEHLVRIYSDRTQTMMDAAVYPLRLYNGNSPFADDRWVVIGIQEQRQTQAPVDQFTRVLVMAMLGALLVNFVLAGFVGFCIADKIGTLARQLHSHPTDIPLSLRHTGLREVDVLADEIMRQNRRALGQAMRLSSILSMTGATIGMYELPKDDATAYCTRGVYQLLGLEAGPTTLSSDECRLLLDSALTEEVEPGVWRVNAGRGTRYVRHRQINQGTSIIGTLLDVTVEMEDRFRVEHERDYDVLTSLLNRRAFARIARSLFDGQREKLGAAAFLMLDLDNLKYINDTYGHDWGDSYIRRFADALNEAFSGPNCLCGRRSGDEFYVLVYGGADQASVNNEINACWDRLTTATIQLPDNRIYPVNASGGVAWYPNDGDSYEALMHYADFAMYKAKHGRKGMLETFDPAVYSQDAVLVSGRDALRRMLDDNLVRYVYQPIVSMKDGSILGYELLMRAQVPELTSPAAVLRVAKEYGMLHHIERMTWFSALSSARKMQARGLLGPDTKLFINSLSNQHLDAADERLLFTAYEDLIPRVVMELTEEESYNKEYTDHKVSMMRSYGAQVAIDDYGTGYNSEVALMRTESDYVKVDMSFVRDVDSRPDKQTMMKSLVAYARSRGMTVLCEGVETAAELATLYGFGAEYVQGYYLGRPQEEPAPVLEDALTQIRALNS